MVKAACAFLEPYIKTKLCFTVPHIRRAEFAYTANAAIGEGEFNAVGQSVEHCLHGLQNNTAGHFLAISNVLTWRSFKAHNFIVWHDYLHLQIQKHPVMTPCHDGRLYRQYSVAICLARKSV